MDSLKSIWDQLNSTSSELEAIVNRVADKSIYEQLEKEQALRKRYNPLLAILLILLPFVFVGLLLQSENGIDSAKVIGIILITLAGIAIAVFSQIIRFPLQQFEHDRSSVEFLQVVKKKLNKSRKMLITGLVLQIALLTAGLYFVIFHNSAISHYHSYLLTFLGFMGALGGLAIGGSVAFFNRHYASIYAKINAFEVV